MCVLSYVLSDDYESNVHFMILVNLYFGDHFLVAISIYKILPDLY